MTRWPLDQWGGHGLNNWSKKEEKTLEEEITGHSAGYGKNGDKKLEMKQERDECRKIVEVVKAHKGYRANKK